MTSGVLKKRVASIKAMGEERGIKIEVTPSEIDPTLWILTNYKTSKVAVVGLVDSFKTLGEYQLVCWGIDVSQYSWASAEGFDKDQICSKGKLRDQIFKQVPLDNILEYLAGNC